MAMRGCRVWTKSNSKMQELIPLLSYLASKGPWYKRWFTTPIAALFCSLSLLILVAVTYLGASYFKQTEPCSMECQQVPTIFQQGIVVDS
jgi:hypothetical protein